MTHPGDNLHELRELPPVELLLDRASGSLSVPRPLLLSWCRDALGEARRLIRGSRSTQALPAHGREEWTRWVLDRVTRSAEQRSSRMLRRVVNATGVILHTNLGRAPLASESQQALAEIAGGYSNLEMDLAGGKRRSRLLPIRWLLPVVTGAESGLAVHNNAAAVFLALAALARGREVIVSRGHLVEIGGSFRLPTIMEASGAQLVEVGATNRTRLSDYAERIGPGTGLILKVHPSNFRMIGFTEEVPTADLAGLAQERGIPLFEDVGSGALDQHAELSFGEPRVQDSLRAGADLVAFSGDKLLGGPQAGILVGRQTIVDRLGKHPLARVLRLDKAALAVLESTLEAYLDPATVRSRIPLLGLLARAPEDLRQRAESLATRMRERCGDAVTIEIVETRAEVGGGSLPGLQLPSWAVSLAAPESVDRIARSFRAADPAVVGRIERDRFLLDMRTVLDGEEDAIIGVSATVFGSSGR
ncbi:MAG: L-seryl-tRNA(Sec) selenium transferase [Candidatus Eisenbacteria bacterium]|uniref:L-seryl-tRNA(Sec) selenium transferase n=1 Tax=Eiseniibacteriota bacterium TaxID=2212470 RepID=A0A956RQV4_UNCEI|nr:L-seryl-tRNA(Sec) selenium transferase [Candidatus Eisenbacteria bacterium]